VKAEAICSACILHDLVGAMDTLGIEGEARGRILTRSFEFLANTFDMRRVPSYYITSVHRILKEETRIELPFAEARARCNEIGVAVARAVAAAAAGMGEEARFGFLVRWAIAGNRLDFRTVGTGYGLDLSQVGKLLNACVEEGLARDETEAIVARVRPGAKVLFIHDNVGEIALDALLLSEIRARGGTVTAALRGGPITSDATLEDGLAVGIDKAAHRVIVAGPDTLGISWEEMTPELRDALTTADLVVAKGQANYYVLSEHRAEIPGEVACLLTTKCDTVSRQFGCRTPANLAVLLPASGA